MALWFTLLTLLGSISISLPASPPLENAPQKKPVLILYYSPLCPDARQVTDYLEKIHKSVPMRNVQDSAEARKELKEQGGRIEVPCLMIDGKPLYEPQPIIKWLSEHQDVLDPK